MLNTKKMKKNLDRCKNWTCNLSLRSWTMFQCATKPDGNIGLAVLV